MNQGILNKIARQCGYAEEGVLFVFETLICWSQPTGMHISGTECWLIHDRALLTFQDDARDQLGSW